MGMFFAQNANKNSLSKISQVEILYFFGDITNNTSSDIVIGAPDITFPEYVFDNGNRIQYELPNDIVINPQDTSKDMGSIVRNGDYATHYIYVGQDYLGVENAMHETHVRIYFDPDNPIIITKQYNETLSIDISSIIPSGSGQKLTIENNIFAEFN